MLPDEETALKLGVDSMMTPHELACHEIAGAMMTLLPGLDANDQVKTERTIGFYLTVFSNVVAFTGADMPREADQAVIELPLYVADFVPQLLESLFAVIDALKSHGGGGVDTVDTYEASAAALLTMVAESPDLPDQALSSTIRLITPSTGWAWLYNTALLTSLCTLASLILHAPHASDLGALTSLHSQHVRSCQ